MLRAHIPHRRLPPSAPGTMIAACVILPPCQISVLRAAEKGGANRQAISSAPGRIEANVVFGSGSVVSLSGDRGFESCSLQRRVSCEPDFLVGIVTVSGVIAPALGVRITRKLHR
jgi:hypothetical protein